jgi:nicotinate phosphoribosyltransferase
VLRDFYAKELLHCIFKDGKLVYDTPPLTDIAAYHAQEKKTFWEEFTRFQNPGEYHVDISDKLYDIKMAFITEHSFKEDKA